MSEILASTAWKLNADMIADVAALGYLKDTDRILDPTWGLGRWWTKWSPLGGIHGSDLDPGKSPSGVSVDFTDLPHDTGTFDVVAFDPPYKLNGTPTVGVDDRYGVDKVSSSIDRCNLIRCGMTECVRVLKGRGYLLVKCQDQVVSGKVCWQTFEFIAHGFAIGLELADRLDMLSYRPQPAGRRQIHARRNSSTLLIFRKR